MELSFNYAFQISHMVNRLTCMDVWSDLLLTLETFPRRVRDLPVQPQVASAEVRAALEPYDFCAPRPLRAVVGDVNRWLTDWTVHVTHPRYFGLFNPSVRDAGIVGETLAALYNPQLAAWSHAPAANEIERHVLRHFTTLLGWNPDTSISNFTSGGAEANLSALLAALAWRYPAAAQHGLGGLPGKAAVYVSGEAHHSLVKAARHVGLGTDALRFVPLTERWTLDPAALALQLEADRHAGWEPLMVVATAGTTAAGLIDPLQDIAVVAAQAGVWLHVDAAWGGATLLSPTLRRHLSGIEQADSVTWDAHKWLSVPLGAGMFFCRHPEAVKRAFAVTTSYMPPETGDATLDPYATTSQWSRRAMGLKVFLALAELGTAGYAELIERQTQMGELLRKGLLDGGWRVVNDTPLPVVCFTHSDLEAGRRSVAALLAVIYQRNRVWLSGVQLGGAELLRACVTSYHTEAVDVACLLGELHIALSEV